MKFLKTPYPRSLNDGKHIFVFGSNLAGRHGAGAALEAVRCWGAIRSEGLGLQGRSYAIPTKDNYLNALPLSDITHWVDSFLYFAQTKPMIHLTFLITPIGTGLAGYSHKQIAPMFKYAPENCILPKEWEFLLAEIKTPIKI